MTSNLDILYKGRTHKISLALDSTLAQLKSILASQFGIPTSEMKLMASGVAMKSENATLSSYGLQSGSRVMMVGERAPFLVPTAINVDAVETPSILQETLVLNKLKTHLDSLNDNIVPMMTDFESFIAGLSDPNQPSQRTLNKTLKDSHAKISELLLQILLKLDGIVVDSLPQARLKRKEAVKHVQSQLDQLDRLFEDAKALISKL